MKHTNTASVTLIVEESLVTPAPWADLSELTGVLTALDASWRGPEHSPGIQWSPCLVELTLTTEGKEPGWRQQINCWPVCPPKSCAETQWFFTSGSCSMTQQPTLLQRVCTVVKLVIITLHLFFYFLDSTFSSLLLPWGNPLNKVSAVGSIVLLSKEHKPTDYSIL